MGRASTALGFTLTRSSHPVRALVLVLVMLGANPSPASSQLRSLAAGARAELAEEQAQLLYRASKSAADFLGAARRYSSIAANWRRAGDRVGTATADYFLGRSYLLAGRPDSALAAFERGLEVLHPQRREERSSRFGRLVQALRSQQANRRAGPSDAQLSASLRREVGAVYLSLGRPDSALVQLLSAEHGCWDHQHLDPRIDYDHAVEAARLDVSSGEVPDFPRFYCFTTREYLWSAIGATYLDLEQPDSALVYFRHAAAEARRDGQGGFLGAVNRRLQDAAADLFFTSPRFPNESRVRSGMAEAFVRLGQPDSAMRQYRRVLAIDRPDSKILRTTDWHGLSRSLIGSGDLLLAAGHADSARAFLESALGLTRRTGDVAMEAVALHGLARYYRDAGEGAERARAFAYFDSASVTKARSRARAPGDENRLALTERNLGIENDWTLAYLAESPGVPSARENVLASLAALERGRARGLLEFLRDSSERHVPNAGADLGASGDSLVRALANGRRVTLTFAHVRDTLLTWVVSADGRVAVTRQPISADSLWILVSDLRAALGVEDAPARGLMVRDEPALEDSASRGAPGSGPRRPDFAGSAHVLAAALLPPGLESELEGGPELLIVPFGVLHIVPFAALPVAGANEVLGGLAPLRFAPSLAVALQLAGSSAGASARQATARPLLVGNPDMPAMMPPDGREAQRLPPLPGAESEVRWLSELLGSQPLIGAMATRDAVFSRLGSSSLVHFATHGFAYASTARARGSFLAVAPEGDHSGLLTAGELLDADITIAAELVVLSACQTGLGGIRASEGVVGLQRAFLAKGARGVLASLWSVSDAATRLYMERFYSHWLDDADTPTAAEALRRAAHDVRQTPGFEHPRYWAAFQLVGGP